jgi:beta-N-acetylhexosaminidase
MMDDRKSFIVGLKSTKLLIKEKKFLIKHKPWGIILFSRNIKNIAQVKKLTDEIRKIFNDKKYPILIDQEGGRVNRLSKFFKADKFTGEFFGNLYLKDKKEFYTEYKKFINKTVLLLKTVGININTLPVLDVRSKGSSSIIGDRAFSSNAKIVSQIGDICIKEFHNNKIAAVIKHTIDKELRHLNNNDFMAFKNKNSLFAMTAHLIYKNIDKVNTATHSKKVIKLIRNQIKFKNILMSDDISMKSLKGSIAINTKKSFSAGCDLVLHCNGNLKEMNDVALYSPFISKFIIKKTSQFYKIIS